MPTWCLVTTTGRQRLRSSNVATCDIPRTRTTLGDRSFTAAGPHLWNNLPLHLGDFELSLSEFRRLLKTHLFGWRSRLYRDRGSHLLLDVVHFTNVLIYLLTYYSRSCVTGDVERHWIELAANEGTCLLVQYRMGTARTTLVNSTPLQTMSTHLHTLSTTPRPSTADCLPACLHKWLLAIFGRVMTLGQTLTSSSLFPTVPNRCKFGEIPASGL